MHKTTEWVIAAEISALQQMENKEIKYIKLMSFVKIYCIFDQINTALLSKRIFFQKQTFKSVL